MLKISIADYMKSCCQNALNWSFNTEVLPPVNRLCYYHNFCGFWNGEKQLCAGMQHSTVVKCLFDLHQSADSDAEKHEKPFASIG